MQNNTPKLINQLKNDATIQQTIRESATDTPTELWAIDECAECIYDALAIEIDVMDKTLCHKVVQYFNRTQRNQAQSSVTKEQILAHIRNIDGQSGTNEANVALHALFETFPSGSQSLDILGNQDDFISDLDQMIAELSLFRHTLKRCMDEGTPLPEEPEAVN